MSSGSSLGLTDKEVVYELASYLHSSILDIMGYGVYTSIYAVALYLTLSRKGDDRPHIGSSVLISIMWILVTIHMSITWDKVDYIYVRNGETRAGQLVSLVSARSQEFLPQRIADLVATFTGLLLADMTMMWRCWVLYGRRWLVVIIPGLSLITGSVCFIWRAIVLFTLDLFWSTTQITYLELIFLLTTIFTNIFCTSAIIYKIVSVSGWKKSLRTYRRLMEILIESSILYTTIYVIRIGLEIYSQYFTKELDDRLLFPRALGYSITGIAPTLIIARVAAGFARPNDSWTRTSLPHMRSTMCSLAESLHFSPPATDTVTDNLDLEPGSVGSEVSVAADVEAEKIVGGSRKTELGQVSKDY